MSTSGAAVHLREQELSKDATPTNFIKRKRFEVNTEALNDKPGNPEDAVEQPIKLTDLKDIRDPVRVQVSPEYVVHEVNLVVRILIKFAVGGNDRANELGRVNWPRRFMVP